MVGVSQYGDAYLILSRDDPVSKFIKNFTVHDGGWSDYLAQKNRTSRVDTSITLRQLASHMAGLGWGYPPLVLDNWPHVDLGTSRSSIRSISMLKVSLRKHLLKIPCEVERGYSSPHIHHASDLSSIHAAAL
jgi:hypothetical protein